MARPRGIKALPDGETKALILSLLKEQDLSVMDLADAIGVSFKVAARHVQALHQGDRKIHIACYRQVSKTGSPRKYFRLGMAPDAARPPPSSETRILACIQGGCSRKRDIPPAAGINAGTFSNVVGELKRRGLIAYSPRTRSWARAEVGNGIDLLMRFCT